MRDAQVTDLSCDVRAGFSRQVARGRKFPAKWRAVASFPSSGARPQVSRQAARSRKFPAKWHVVSNPPSHGGLEEDDVEACASVGCVTGAN